MPVDNDIVNVAKAGQTVPLKFHVSDANGPVTDLSPDAVSVTVAGLACDLGDTSDQIEEYASGDSGLQNLGDGNYQFNWKTPKAYASSCKTLSVDVGDDVGHTAEFRFTKSPTGTRSRSVVAALPPTASPLRALQPAASKKPLSPRVPHSSNAGLPRTDLGNT